MKKTTKQTTKSDTVVDIIPTEIPVIKNTISLIGADMGREDLNKMAEKINEIINFINK